MSEYGVGREAEAQDGVGAGVGAGAGGGGVVGVELEAGVGPGDGGGGGDDGGGGDGELDGSGESGESWFERRDAVGADRADGSELSADGSDADVCDPDEGREPVEDYVDSDPQQWISGLIADLERAEQGIGSGPRDVLMARIKLAQAYSELGDTVQAAPLAVANVAQAQRLFPSSEGMLRQLREFRDAACEAAGWTAAMMREPDEADEGAFEEPSELVARPWAKAADEERDAEPESEPEPESWAQPVAEAVAEPERWAQPVADAVAESQRQSVTNAFTESQPQPVTDAATGSQPQPVTDAATGSQPQPVADADAEPQQPQPQPQSAPWPVSEAVAEAWPAVEVAEDEELVLGVETEGAPESAGAVIHEFIRRAPESDAAWTAEPPSAVPSPAELAIPTPPEPEYAEEVARTVPAAELAAFEEIIRLRYELREAHRTIDRLKHVNRKLREALDFESE